MKVFATRVWGFDPQQWPVITFGLEGNRDKLLNDSAPGDRIVFVGTQGEPTAEHHRGRLLGMAEIGRLAVDTLDVIGSRIRRAEDYDESGRFRWPKAILMVRAWAFEPQPVLREVLSAQLPYNATPQAVELSTADADAVLKLPVVDVVLPASPALDRARLLDQALTANRPTTGPTPTSWSGEVGRDTSQPAFTYALRFGRTDVWKIGHAVDLVDRVKQINWHIPTEVIADQWKPFLQQKWQDEQSAHAMEQRVLVELSSKRTQAERVRCSEGELQAAWLRAIGVGK